MKTKEDKIDCLYEFFDYNGAITVFKNYIEVWCPDEGIGADIIPCNEEDAMEFTRILKKIVDKIKR